MHIVVERGKGGLYVNELEKYAQQASIYEQLACYYKYTNPQMYMYVYAKHVEAIQQVVHTYEKNRISPSAMSQATQPTYLRVFHSSSDLPRIDIMINGKKMIKNLSFKQCSPYLSFGQGQYRLDIAPAETEQPIFSTLVPIMGNHAYTFAVTGSETKVQTVPILDSTPLPSGKAKLRFIHLSPDTPAVDVFLKDGESLFEKVSFQEATDYVQVSPGVVNIEVYLTGLKNSILSIPETEIMENKLYIIALIGHQKKSPNLEAIFLTN